MDGHKVLGQPFGIGCLLVRDGRKLRAAMTADDLGPFYPGTDPQDVTDTAASFFIPNYSCELTRSNRGFPTWVFLKVMGTKFICELFEEKLALAQYFYEQMAGIPGIVRGPRPMLCSVVFWFSIPGVDIHIASRRFDDELRKDKRIFMEPMEIGGKFALRFSIIGIRSHKEHVDMCIRVIRETAAFIMPHSE
jgi:glutamate/tyrosine decarboxylase-like PLP-dependent enzyme